MPPEITKSVSDEEYQTYALQGVSRTFALTIPQLPETLSLVVGNAYLLCRIADTIEDEPALNAEQKRRFSQQFVRVVAGKDTASEFATALYPLLSHQTLEAERDLIQNTPKVIRLTHRFTPNQRAAMERCVTIMASGMSWFQATKNPYGLKDLPHMDSYCYYVAGVVGEMLTEFYCEYSDEIRKNRERMMELAVSFGQGLQMTNILKDIWDDRDRAACWLPQDVFRKHGFDLGQLSPENYDPQFGSALRELVGVAHAHLQNALAYTLMIPSQEKGIREFCFWALGMALLTLQKIYRHPDFNSRNQVKITRRAVKTVVLASRFAVNHDKVARVLFKFGALGLPYVEQNIGGRLPRFHADLLDQDHH